MENKFQIGLEQIDEEERTGKYEKVYSVFLNFLLGLLSYIIPKNSKQVLAGSYLFVGNPKYFFLYLSKMKSNECKAIWITRSKKIYSKLQADGFRVVYLKSWKGFFSILRSRYLLFSHGSRDVSFLMRLPGRFNKIQLWHGIATKHLARPPVIPKSLPFYERLTRRQIIQDRKSYHTILTCSAKTQKRDIVMFQNENVKILGFPRTDVFFDRSNVYEDFSMKFNLKKYDKIIIYSPTWRETSFGKHFGSKIPFSDDFLKKLNSYLRNKNYIMLCKGHKDEIGSRLNFPDFSNIKNISKKIDVQDLLVDVDIMITDYSSIFKDFCLSGKPTIFYPFDYDEYIKNRPIYTDYFNELPGPFARTEQDLLNTLENLNSIVSNNEYSKKYKQLVDDNHFYQDGKSSERLYDYLFKKKLNS